MYSKNEPGKASYAVYMTKIKDESYLFSRKDWTGTSGAEERAEGKEWT